MTQHVAAPPASPAPPAPPTETDRPVPRLAALISAHPVVDMYSNFVAPLFGLLQVRCDLTDWQLASLVSVGPLVSGGCQPLVAWLTDRTGWTVIAPLGLALAAACISMVGFADNYWSLLIIYALGMIGVGAFHPVAASTVGRLGGARRSVAVTMFFTAGMIGSSLGPIISATMVTHPAGGFSILHWAMAPGIVMTLVLAAALRGLSHDPLRTRRPALEPRDVAQRWLMIWLLFASNVLRYSLNTAFIYLFVRWSQYIVAADAAGLPAATPREIATLATPLNGRLNALMMAGMAIGGLTAGMLIKPGRERWPFVLIPIVLCPSVALFAISGEATGHVLAFLVGVGYAAVIPSSISLAQRILPHRSSLASSMMMGGAWSVGTLGSIVAYEASTTIGLNATFLLFAAVLFTSGLLSLPLRTRQYVQ